jgi:hypothetical protein
MQGKVAYIGPKVVGPGARGSYVHRAALLKGSPSAAVKLLHCNHEIMGSSPRNNLFTYIRPKVVEPCASGSYMHRAALLKGSPVAEIKLLPCDH